NGYLLRDPRGNLCIDPVEMSDEVLAALAREGVSRILLTNRNHYRACEKVRVKTGAGVWIHDADAAFVREKGVVVEGALRPGERVGPLRVVAAPGKSPGEVALFWKERRLLFIGDACVGNPPGALGLLPDKVMDDLPELKRSLRWLTELDF